MTDNVVLFTLVGETALIRLNRPEVHNCINDVVMDRLESLLDRIEPDDGIKTIILTGSGRESFCAGGDLRYFSTLKSSDEVKAMSLRMQKILNRFWEGNKPVIAAINGKAFGGGCEILTYCHVRIASSYAHFNFRHAANGIITGWGGGQRLFRQIGRSALPLLLTARSFTTTEALHIHFIDKIIKFEKLLNEALALAAHINNTPTGANQNFLQLSRLALNTENQDISRFEAETFVELWKREVFQKVLKKYQP